MARVAAWLAMGAALALSACGFHPLYGTDSFPEGAQKAFAAVGIDPVGPTNDSDRIGNLVSDALDVALHPPGPKAPAQSVLKVKLADERRGLAVQDDASITRYTYRLTADWVLTSIDGKSEIAKGTAQTTASYNVVDSQYSTLVAREDAEKRAAREIAELIKLKIAVVLAKPA